MHDNNVRTIGITLGDPAGIGPEITAAALGSGKLPADFDYRVIGAVPDGTHPGQPTAEGASAAIESLEAGTKLALAGDIAALVTAPVSKVALQQVGFQFPGQTEFLADRCGVDNFAMALTGGGLTVALVTIHIPLADVPRCLDSREIVRVGKLLAEFTSRLEGVKEPRLAVAGLNPHAGENGTIGSEERAIIHPAIEELSGLLAGSAHVSGPHPPDTVFHQAVEGAFDAVLCMYHDQALIPLKMHAFHSGVNTTLGLPIVRTSPDHGTAFDIAGQGNARADSMISAIQLAARLARQQD